MRWVARTGSCLTALAIGACNGGRPAPAPAPRDAPAAAIGGEPIADQPSLEPVPPAPPRGTHRAIAADLSGSGEPMIAVTGGRDASGAAEVSIYAQRNGGWRRLTGGAWPASDGAAVTAVDAADLDGDGALELVALGSADAADTHLAVYRMRDRDLDLVAETSWRGRPGALELVDLAGEAAILIRDRRGRARRAFVLAGTSLAERPPAQLRSARRSHTLAMSLPAPAGPMRVAIAAASGGPTMLVRIAAWNDELARLRQP